MEVATSWVPDLPGVLDSLIAAVIGGFFTLLCVRPRNRIGRFLRIYWHSLVVLAGRKPYILFWNDVNLHYSCKLIAALQPNLPRHRLHPIGAPFELQDYYLGPKFVSAIVLIDTDVSKFAADAKVADRIERQLTRFLMRGGGVVGTHDVIYSRVRNQQLQAAFGGSVTDFKRTPDPIRYLQTSAGREHPLSKDLPDSFELEDGEVIWGHWEKDCTIHYETTFEERTTPVVVSREHLNGRLVWIHSGDKGHTLARSISDPQKDFVRIIANSLLWVSGQSRDLRQEGACQIVAHRGASLSKHENSLEAFEHAIGFGADYAELDVRRTSDRFLVVHHDPDVNGKPIASNTLEVLQSSARDRGYLLATLEDVLILCRGKIRLDVELKEEGYEEDVLRSVRSVLADREFVITSFSDLSLRRIKLHFSDVRCGLLLGRADPRRRFLTRWTEFFPVRRALNIGVDFVAPHHSLLRFGFSKRLRANGIPLWVWTIDDPGLIQKFLRDLSVEAIITNAPDVALAERKRMTEKTVFDTGVSLIKHG
jgi:glycerophosphoryl diester phosphodiesterase